ncbi:MAG: protein-export chaperone SecB [Pseudomonadales bacterium]|nr:protein-export chaperone SecB [Pseudomonadales bacterium]
MAEEDNNNPQPAVGGEGAQEPTGPQFGLQRIYLKDSSFESPRAPQIFQSQWQPKVNFDIKMRNAKVAEDVYEAVISLTAEAIVEEETGFLVEVHQAGVFTVKDFPEAELEQILATVCPNILFPYARESIDALVTKGGFPALMLSPLNFDALYRQKKQQEAEQAAAGGNDAAAPNPIQ